MIAISRQIQKVVDEICARGSHAETDKCYQTCKNGWCIELMPCDHRQKNENIFDPLMGPQHSKVIAGPPILPPDNFRAGERFQKPLFETPILDQRKHLP